MQKRFAAVCLLVILLFMWPLLPGTLAAESAESELFDLLEQIPIAAFADGWFGYVDFDILLNAFPGAVKPQSVEDYRRMTSDPDWRNTMNAYQSIMTGPREILLTLDIGERVLEQTGIDLFSIERGLSLGDPPAQQIWLEGQFDVDLVQDRLLARGYDSVPSEHDTFRVYAPDGDIAGGNALDFENIDPAFVFGGDLGRSWPVLLSGSLIVSTSDAGNVQAISDGADESLLSFPGLEALLTAVDERAAGALGQLYVLTLPAIGFDMPNLLDLESVIDLPADDPIIGLKRDRSLPGYFAIAVAQSFDEEAQRVELAIVFDSPESAKTAGDILEYRLLDAVSQRTLEPIDTTMENLGGRRLPVETAAGADGTGIVTVPFRFPLTDEAGEPAEMGYAAYRYFINLFLQRDFNWLRIGP